MTVAAASTDAPYPRASRAWLVVGILFVATLLSQLDRQLPALLVRPIRATFDVSDTQFSFLQGYAFALVYTLMGLPFGRLVDRTNRRNLIFVGMLFWSASTALAAFAADYQQLLLSRVGVGIGEAVLAPAAYSIVADYFAPPQRGRALSAYYVSLAIGSGASLLLGGLLLRLIPAEGLPVGGDTLAPWRVVFLVAGAPGLAFALLLLLVREPTRRGPGATGTPASIAQFFAHLRAHASTFARLLTYPALLAIIGYGMLAWAPAFFDRRFHIEPAESSLILGVLVAISGLLGTLASGFLSDRWLARSVPAARFRVTLVAWVLMLPSVASWSLAPSAPLSFALLALGVAGLSIGQAAAPVAIQEIVPNNMRGQAIAVYLLLGGLLGIGFGPTSVALVTDYVFKDDQALPYALACVAAPAALLGLWLTLSGLGHYARSHQEMAAQT